MSDLVNGDIIEEYRNKLDAIAPKNWTDNVDLDENEVMIKSAHFYELRDRINDFVSIPYQTYSAGCAAGCAGLCEGCAGTCTGGCSGSCTGSCSGSCRGTCTGGCSGCSDRWF